MKDEVRQVVTELVNKLFRGGQNKQETIDEMVELIVGEAIGEDEPMPEIPVNDYHWRIRNELRAKQRAALSTKLNPTKENK